MAQPRSCRKPRAELLLNSIVAGLFHEARVPNGAIVDAGANDGAWACMYASLDAARTVHAIEPLAGNVEKIRALNIANIHAILGALGNRSAWLDAGQKRIGQLERLHAGGGSMDASGMSAPFRMMRLDDLVREGTIASLGFMHFDCEGSEADVLRGAVQAIARWQPIFTVEVHVHLDRAATIALLGVIEWLRYDAYLVEEPCGIRLDCRNLLCVPRSRTDTLIGSPTLDLAAATNALVAVSADTVLGHAYPCCALGGFCCPTSGAACCAHWRVNEWRRACMNLTQYKGARRDRVRAERWTFARWPHGTSTFDAGVKMLKRQQREKEP